MSASESDTHIKEQDCTSKKRRRIKQPETYKGNKIKLARLKGDHYVNHRGKSIPAKQPAFTCK